MYSEVATSPAVHGVFGTMEDTQSLAVKLLRDAWFIQ
jgi:hypothetical protein